ncbi:MAG: T9SS type A sorting domain-containing protein, partial [Psychroserpens sp.]|nr:T9SS type A sorting domain-containing protein [Psychroserpens sp.]
LLSFSPFGQSQNNLKQNQYIEGLNIYPNPIQSETLHIVSKQNAQKTIEIFDVLGKRRLAASILGKELDISRLTPGLYIIKIHEKGITETRKLVVK